MGPQKLTLDRHLQLLVEAVAAQQDALDAGWESNVRAFLPVWALARAGGLEALARSVAPRRLVATEATVDTQMFVSHDRATGLGVRLAALGLQKRYERSTTSLLRVRCTLAAGPNSPSGTAAEGRTR